VGIALNRLFQNSTKKSIIDIDMMNRPFCKDNMCNNSANGGGWFNNRTESFSNQNL